MAPHETRYFLGIDIGATNSHGLIADEHGRAAGFGQAGGGNHERVGWDGFRQVLQTVTDRALASAGITKAQLSGVGLGMGGYDWPEDREPIRRRLELLGLNAPYEFVNDAIIGLLAGSTAGWGVAIVAGTGSNCWGRDQWGNEGRVTGEGFRFAEYAGASDLVAKAIQVVSLAWSRRGPATQLTETLLAETQAADVTDLLAGLARQRYKLTSDHAPLVFQVATAGDPVAQEIIRWAGRELGDLANGVIRQLGFEQENFEVVLVGSLYNGSPVLVNTLQETIQEVAPQAKLVRLQAPPVMGGVLLAMEQVNLETAAIRPTLINSTNALLVELH
jgi:N-acetylglucosamine kinase-like BadF-type ATPase